MHRLPERILEVAALAHLFASACTAPPLPLDEPLPSDQARAGKVHQDSELIGGPVAYGRTGDVWKLYNSQARFLIQDQGTSVGLDLYGGNLIDADLVRPGDDGKNGNDLFRETFPIVGLRASNPTSIEVVSDGLSGGPAQIRVHATDVSSAILPQIDDIGQELGGDITTDYILLPGVPYLQIVTTYRATSDQTLPELTLGDFLSFGASLTVISPENGFTGNAATVSFLAAIGNGTSYGYVSDADLTIPIVDASGTVTILKTPAVNGGDTVQMNRYLVVGNGDAASVMRPMYALRGSSTFPITGVVKTASGAPLAGARVTLFSTPYDLTDSSLHALNQATTQSDGSYFLDAPPGDYAVVVSGVGRLRSQPADVSLSGPLTLNLQAGESGGALLDIGEQINGVRQPVPAKVSFLGQNVEAPDPRFGPDPTESERNGVSAMAVTADGTGQAALKPGTYDVIISRGPEYEIVRQTGVVIPPLGGSPPTFTITADLQRVVDSHGYVSGDYHQHTQRSIDSPLPLLARVLENLAEGVEFPAVTDHDNIADYQPYIQSLNAQPFMNAISGDEISVNGIGHFNAYPLTVDPTNPYAKIGAKLWANTSIEDMVARVRSLETSDIIVHVSHPRTKSLAGYFNSVHFDPVGGGSDDPVAVSSFDAIEVNGDIGQATDYLATNDPVIQKHATQDVPSDVPTLRDLFSFLNQGRSVCALGNSDAHQRNDDTGYPRNYLLVGKDDPRSVTPTDLVKAIRGQQVTISNGPFLTVLVNGTSAYGKAHAINLQGAPTAVLNVAVQAPSWISVSTLEVYENGRPLTLSRLPGNAALAAVPPGTTGANLTAQILPTDGHGAYRFDGTITVSPTRDAWYIVVVRDPGTLLPVASSSPYAYNNPVYVDTAGDGWTAPGL